MVGAPGCHLRRPQRTGGARPVRASPPRRPARLVGAVIAASIAVTAGAALASCWSLSDPLPAATQSGGAGGSGGSITAGGGGASATGGGGAEPCVPAEPPPAPGATGSTSAGGWIFALRTVRFQSGEGGAMGYDLDDLCTCPGPESCVTDADPHCDESGGRDNTLGPALDGAITVLMGATAGEIFTGGAEAGDWALLLDVEALDLPDDPDVVVIAESGATCCGGAGPTWDGSDPWPTDGALSATTTDQAYLSDHQLVARFSLLEVHLRKLADPVLRLSLRMRDAVLTATLDSTSAPAQLSDGVVVGQLSEADLFWGLDSIQFGPNALCQNHVSYGTIKALVCDARDLSSQGAASPCDRASIALGFTATEVATGATAAVVPKYDCTSGQEPLNDTCQ